MGRSWTETVEDFRSFRPDLAHRCCAIDVFKSSNPADIRVNVQHLDKPQAGRSYEVVLPLPVRPAVPSAEFFRACGIAITAGHSFCPDDRIGKAIKARFAPAGDGAWNIAAFKPVTEHVSNDQ